MTTSNEGEDAFVFYEEESFNGGIARWAADMWIERMLDVTRIAGVEWGHRQTAASAGEQDIRALAEEMEVDPRELLLRAMPIIKEGVGHCGFTRFRGLTVPVTLIEKRCRRIAPAALSIAPYHRSLWDLRLFPVCLETGQILIDDCGNPACEGGALGWRQTLGIDRCEHCMADLIESQTSEMSTDLVAELRCVARLFQVEERENVLATLPPPIAGSGGKVAVELLLRLLTVIDPNLKPFRNALHRADPLVLASAVAGAWNMMTDWPHGFEKFAIEKISKREAIHLDGNGGETIRFLKTKETSTVSAEVAEIARETRDTMDLGGGRANEVANRTVSIKPAATLLSLATAEVAQHRRDGNLRIEIVIDERERLQPMFNRSEIEAIADGISSRMGLDSFAWKLGVSRNGAEQLVEMGYLDLLDHPFFRARYDAPQVTAASSERFLESLNGPVISSLDKDEVPLSIAMKIIGGRLKPWGPVLSKLVDGSLPFRIKDGSTFLVRRLVVKRKALPIILGLHFADPTAPNVPISDSISKADAQEILNIGGKEGVQLFADVPTRKGDRKKSLMVDAVIDLGRRHITSAELALRRNVSVQKAYNDAFEKGVPYLGPAGFCRSTAEATFLR